MLRTLRRRHKIHGNRDYPHDLRALIKLAKDQRFTVDSLDSHRLRFKSPEGESRVIARSGEPRAILNIIATLRRMGLKPAQYHEREEEDDAPPPTLHEPPRLEDEPPRIVRHELRERREPAPLSTPIADLISNSPHKEPAMNSVIAYPARSTSPDNVLAKIDGSSAPKPDRRRVVLRAVERIDLGTGVHPKQAIDHVHVHFPTLDLKSLQTQMASYSSTGYLIRRGDGRYSLADKGREALAQGENYKPPRAKRTPRSPVVASAPAMTLPTIESTDEDVRILDEALALLSNLERVIRRHREVALSLAQLSRVLGAASALVNAAPATKEPPQS